MDIYINLSEAMQQFNRIAARKSKLAESENNAFSRGEAHAWSRAASMLSMMQPADVQPVIYTHRTINVGLRSYCNNCGKLAYMENFCTQCGAKVGMPHE